ncbi:hypothetical protein WME79_33500 [Sorangium sp. So ce726]|uniref:hypothetical protein n=1 Tax=Sorangium sp. So ce726 TaxID=3133319 RepID=UPI003F61C6D2
MSRRRRINTNDMPRSGNVIHVSARQMWELAWVRKLGLEDIEWDPAHSCEHCSSDAPRPPPHGSRADLGAHRCM